MSTNFDISKTLDVKGASCPMPVIKTKQASDDLAAGEVMEVVSTDSGSMSDIKGWAETTDGVELVDQVEGEEDGEAVFKHYVKKSE
jgi:TusA-related sulfurtransferase